MAEKERLGLARLKKALERAQSSAAHLMNGLAPAVMRRIGGLALGSTVWYPSSSYAEPSPPPLAGSSLALPISLSSQGSSLTSKVTFLAFLFLSTLGPGSLKSTDLDISLSSVLVVVLSPDLSGIVDSRADACTSDISVVFSDLRGLPRRFFALISAPRFMLVGGELLNAAKEDKSGRGGINASSTI